VSLSAPDIPVEAYEYDPEQEAYQRHPASRPRLAPDPITNEEDMLELADRLEDASVEYKGTCDQAARADADYHRRFYGAMIALPANVRPAEVRKARAWMEAADEYEAWKILGAAQEGSRRHLESLHKKLDVRRTLAATYRLQG